MERPLFRRPAGGDGAAIHQNRDSIRQGEHDVHIMLDQHDGQLSLQAFQDFHHPGRFLRPHAGHRFVQQQQGGAGARYRGLSRWFKAAQARSPEALAAAEARVKEVASREWSTRMAVTVRDEAVPGYVAEALPTSSNLVLLTATIEEAGWLPSMIAQATRKSRAGKARVDRRTILKLSREKSKGRSKTWGILLPVLTKLKATPLAEVMRTLHTHYEGARERHGSRAIGHATREYFGERGVAVQTIRDLATEFDTGVLLVEQRVVEAVRMAHKAILISRGVLSYEGDAAPLAEDRDKLFELFVR